jgi:hypothetical protein
MGEKRDGTVELDGKRIGTVEKRRVQTTHTGGSGGYTYAVGFSYATRWFWRLDGESRDLTFGVGCATRKRAVEELVARFEKRSALPTLSADKASR